MTLSNLACDGTIDTICLYSTLYPISVYGKGIRFSLSILISCSNQMILYNHALENNLSDSFFTYFYKENLLAFLFLFQSQRTIDQWYILKERMEFRCSFSGKSSDWKLKCACVTTTKNFDYTVWDFLICVVIWIVLNHESRTSNNGTYFQWIAILSFQDQTVKKMLLQHLSKNEMEQTPFAPWFWHMNITVTARKMWRWDRRKGSVESKRKK